MHERRPRPERSARDGFTLIEIMLVVVIIGILAGIATVKFTGRIGQSQEAAAQASIEAIGLALDLYEIDNFAFPQSLQSLVTDPGSAPNWRGPYLKKGLPKDPWGNAFQYRFPGSRNPNSYDLFSLGADGSESGDDLGNWQTD
jgi:general secretion pathway protein G